MTDGNKFAIPASPGIQIQLAFFSFYIGRNLHDESNVAPPVVRSWIINVTTFIPAKLSVAAAWTMAQSWNKEVRLNKLTKWKSEWNLTRQVLP